MAAPPDDIKVAPIQNDLTATETEKVQMEDRDEVFKRIEGQVDFRTVSWVRAGVIFLKSESSSPPEQKYRQKPITLTLFLFDVKSSSRQACFQFHR